MRILLSCYACEPGEGSEPGAGWAWAQMLSGLGEVWVVTRANNRGAIEQYGTNGISQDDRLTFVYVDLPQWAARWKRGRRGLHVYYIAWQSLAFLAAARLHRKVRFDLAWHVTLANAWLGSTMGFLGIPFVHGPVGGGVRVPIRLFPLLGFRGAVYEIVRGTVVALARYLNPLARAAWRQAELILVQNRETRDWLPRRHRHKVVVLPNVVVSNSFPRIRPQHGRVALFAGRLLPWKGVSLAIRAIARTPDWELLVCGSGPDEQRLERLVIRHGLGERVRLLGTLPRDQLLELMRTDVDVLLFPSMREEAGWVVGEAASVGLPVICLDRGGPPLLGGFGASASSPRRTSEELAQLMMSAHSTRSISSRLDPPSRLEQIRSLLKQKGLLPNLDREQSKRETREVRALEQS